MLMPQVPQADIFLHVRVVMSIVLGVWGALERKTYVRAVG